MSTSEQPARIDTASLTDEVAGLRREVSRLNGHRFIQMHDKPAKLIMFQLFRGMAFGLGSVLGASILLSIIVSLLSSIDFIPVIGDWATQIVNEIDAGSAESYGIEEETNQ